MVLLLAAAAVVRRLRGEAAAGARPQEVETPAGDPPARGALPSPAHSSGSTSRLRLLLGAAGAAVLAYGVLGLLQSAQATTPVHTGLWLVGGILAHELVIGPVVAVTGWLLIRLVPSWARAIVQGGLIVAAVVTLVALPAVLRQGAPDVYSSLLPLDYRANLRNLLLGIAVVTALLVAGRRVRYRRSTTKRRVTPDSLADQSSTG